MAGVPARLCGGAAEDVDGGSRRQPEHDSRCHVDGGAARDGRFVWSPGGGGEGGGGGGSGPFTRYLIGAGGGAAASAASAASIVASTSPAELSALVAQVSQPSESFLSL